jgi:hypothetical protein
MYFMQRRHLKVPVEVDEMVLLEFGVDANFSED